MLICDNSLSYNSHTQGSNRGPASPTSAATPQCWCLSSGALRTTSKRAPIGSMQDSHSASNQPGPFWALSLVSWMVGTNTKTPTSTGLAGPWLDPQCGQHISPSIACDKSVCPIQHASLALSLPPSANTTTMQEPQCNLPPVITKLQVWATTKEFEEARFFVSFLVSGWISQSWGLGAF